jgi:hypothetical protein
MLNYFRFRTVHDLFGQGKSEEARLELADLQRRYVAVCDENVALKMRIQEYEDILYLARNLVREDGLCWLLTGDIRQGPFCPLCYERDGLLLRLTCDTEERFCAVCRSVYPKASPEPFIINIPAKKPEPRPARKAKILPFVR